MDVIRRIVPALVIAALLAAPFVAATPAAAQPQELEELYGVLTETFESELRANLFQFENFFQAPEGVPEEDVTLTRLEARLAGDLSQTRPWGVYARARWDSYGSGLDEAWAAGVGTRYDGEVHGLDLYGEYEQDRPVFDVGDEFDRADVLRFDGEYSYRVTEAWQLSALGEYRDEEFSQIGTKDNEFTEAGGAVRYRGWGYLFSPEIGAEWGSRDAIDPNEDMDQRDLWIKFRSIPVPDLYLSLRYRYRTRDYTIGDPAASNFDREDDRRQWVLAADYGINDWLSVNGYWSYEDADSTKDTRIFETSLYGVGVAVGF